MEESNTKYFGSLYIFQMKARFLNEEYQEICESIYEEIVDCLFEDFIAMVEDMNLDELHSFYDFLLEDKEKVERAKRRAAQVEKKRSKQVDTIHKMASQTSSSGKQYNKQYLKKFKGMVAAQRAQKYYSGDMKPSESEKGKGYRAPQSRIR